MPKDDGLKEYVLKQGKTHMADGVEVKAGDKVKLNDEQAKAFADKFESVEEMNERLKLQDELGKTKAQQAKIAKALEAKGIKLEDLLAEAEVTDKDPPKPESEGKRLDDSPKDLAGNKQPEPAATTTKVEPPKTK